MCIGGGKTDNGAAQARQQEQQRRARISAGMTNIDNAFSGFDDGFYGAREKAYVDYATPKLDNDYQEALRQMAYALERRGLTGSTAAGNEQKRLEGKFNDYRTDILSAGKSYADRARSDIEGSRSNLVNQLNMTEDPAAAGASAARIAANATQPPAFDPVGTFVFEMSEGMRRASDESGYKPVLPPTLFSRNPTSSIRYYNE